MSCFRFIFNESSFPKWRKTRNETKKKAVAATHCTNIVLVVSCHTAATCVRHIQNGQCFHAVHSISPAFYFLIKSAFRSVCCCCGDDDYDNDDGYDNGDGSRFLSLWTDTNFSPVSLTQSFAHFSSFVSTNIALPFILLRQYRFSIHRKFPRAGTICSLVRGAFQNRHSKSNEEEEEDDELVVVILFYLHFFLFISSLRRSTDDWEKKKLKINTRNSQWIRVNKALENRKCERENTVEMCV